MNDVRYTIIATAKKLFINQGYKKTTIRQIVDESGILIGSIYYFFKNKEEIFQSIILGMFDIADNYLVEKCGRDLSPPLQYAILSAVELKASDMNEQICEMFYQAYSMNGVMHKLVTHAAERSKRLFQDNILLTKKEHFLRTLGLVGVMRNYIATRYIAEDLSYDTMINTYLDLSLPMYNINPDEIEEIKETINNMTPEIIEIVNSLINHTFVE
ncbi:MAG: helix-turn-helix transcriptional regulator [Clostridiales bacterium]|nr:helix-turn-helix transcriptional regulator [Clostridiales bacterium]